MPLPTPNQLLEALDKLPAAQPLLRALGAETGVYLVGGAVRDLLLGQAPGELDVVVEGDAPELARRLGGVLRAHDRFGTATVSLDGFSYDLATARREAYSHPGALPEVSPAPLADDLLRRDFTVNAIALGLSGAERGRLAAAPGALDDLGARVLRVLHEQSFLDDPTRLLRLARYAARLSFVPEPRTRVLADSAVAEGALGTVSGTRIGQELRLLAREPDPVQALVALRGLGVDRAIASGFGLEDPEMVRRALALLPQEGRRDRLVLAAAALGMTGPEVEALLERLGLDAGDRAVISQAAGAGELAGALERARRPSEIAEVSRGAPLEVVALAGALGPSEPAMAWLESLRHVALEIDGDDLLAAGVPPGPAIGEGLRAALAAKLDGSARDRGDELAEAVRAARPTG